MSIEQLPVIHEIDNHTRLVLANKALEIVNEYNDPAAEILVALDDAIKRAELESLVGVAAADISDATYRHIGSLFGGRLRDVGDYRRVKSAEDYHYLVTHNAPQQRARRTSMKQSFIGKNRLYEYLRLA